MIKAVLFDLDGTLVNTLQDLAVATNHALTQFGYPTRPVENFRQYAGNGNAVMMERALPKEGRKPEIIEQVKQAFFDYYGQHPADYSTAYEGIVPLLRRLKKQGIHTAVVTNKASAMTNRVVPAVFGDTSLFDAVVGQTPDIPLKPQPHMAYVAMNEIGVNADECLFVGDSATDMMTAHSAGNVPVGVLWGFRDETELKNAGARFLVSQPQEIADLIHTINEGL